MPLLDALRLAQCERLAMIARQAGRRVGAARGAPLSAGPGDWAGHRDYSPGDDYRAIDWGVCARHDELRTRRPAAETGRRFDVLLDCSRSMEVGSPTKFEAARQVVEVLACIAAHELADVRLWPFAQRVTAPFVAARGHGGFARLSRLIESLPADGAPTDFAQAAADWRRMNDQSGPLVVISDCFAWDGFERGLDLLRRRGCDPYLIHLFDARDADPGLSGDVALIDVETGGAWRVRITERDAARYCRLFQEFCAKVRDYCGRRRLAYSQVRTDGVMDESLWRRVGGVLL